ncbi:MAG TPA: RNA chaperone Hfq [Armatimonadaceae bacterium]|nr:RNA chaperone Hfq [Armatimonadaceae bacterium]
MDIVGSGGNERSGSVQRHSAEMIRYRDERKPLVFTLVNGATIEGAVRWFDDGAVCIVDADRDEVTVFKHAILHYRAAKTA